MGMRAAQIQKAGALELRPAIRIQTPKPTRKADRIGGRFFHVRSNSKTGIDRLYDSLRLKRSGARQAAPPVRSVCRRRASHP
jgi:hypothetical protein